LQDLLLIIVILLTLGITIIIGNLVFTKLSESGLTDNRNSGADYHTARLIMNNTRDKVIPQFDVIFVGVLVAGILGAAILAFAVRSLPVFFIAGFVFIIIIIMISAIISNVYDEIADHAQLTEYSSPFTAMEFVMSNLPLFILGGAVLISIVLYGMWRLQI